MVKETKGNDQLSKSKDFSSRRNWCINQAIYLPCQGSEKWVCVCIGMAMWVMGNYGKELQIDKQQKLRDRFVHFFAIFFSFLIIDQELLFKMTFWE